MFTKCVVRWAVISGLVGGAAVVIAGPDRVGAILAQTRSHINAGLDKAIEDPVALRAQLKSLEGQYPQRIAEVRGDLAELQAQTAQLHRDLQISERVVALADQDLGRLQAQLARAEAAQDGIRPVQLQFDNEHLDIKEARARAAKIQQVRNAYASKAADIQRDLGYLSQQESRLGQLAGQLESEHAEYQAQMWQLDRQVDAIARNDRMISMMEKRQAAIDEHSRYRSGSLDQIAARMADIRARQEARLEVLGQGQTQSDYEDRAKLDLDSGADADHFLPDHDEPGIRIIPEPRAEPTSAGRAQPVRFNKPA